MNSHENNDVMDNTTSNVITFSRRFDSPMPFPVPPQVEMELMERGGWQWWVNEYGQQCNEPVGLCVMSLFRETLVRQLGALREICEAAEHANIDPHDPGFQAVGIVTNLLRSMDDFSDLISFCSKTLPYDPAVTAWIERAHGKRVAAAGGES